jgi:formylglycine-generating enzyme required for sulfatase activity
MKIEMIEVKGGSFIMGSKKGKHENSPLHEVYVDSFLLGKYLVTQSLWQEVYRTSPSRIKKPEYPITNIDWYDAVEFCNEISISEDLEPYYVIERTVQDENNMSDINRDRKKWKVSITGSEGFRLPAEEEWEYAARGGINCSEFEYSGSDIPSDVLFDDVGPGEKKYPVGQKMPNALGIYDMSGNVGEWCHDWFYLYGLKETSGSVKLYRGHSTVLSLDDATVYARKYNSPAFVSDYLGLRVARNKK